MSWFPKRWSVTRIIFSILSYSTWRLKKCVSVFFVENCKWIKCISKPKIENQHKEWLNWLFVVISPVLVGIDVRMIFCLIFKWFTLFSCKLSRNKLVLIPLSTVLHLPLLFTSLLLTTDKFCFTFFLFAFHFNTLKHFFHLRLLVVNSCCCWIHRTSRRHCCFVFVFFSLQFATIAATRVWRSVIVNVFYSFSFILLVWVWMCLVSFLLAIFFLFLF